MKDSSTEIILSLIEGQKSFFASQQTRSYHFRIEQLKRFKSAILKYEKRIAEALWDDLHKSYEEAFLTEMSLVTQEIDNHIAHLSGWLKPKKVSTPIHLQPSSSYILTEPLGVALIIAPWNYPFQLLMNPLVGAISAGCCALLKPSPYTPAVAKVMEELITETFEPAFVAMVQGGRGVNAFLLSHRFDIIFYTGSPAVGKVVMKAAAEYLTPVVLELGGKSPCIVDQSANIDVAAKRIVFGKTINAGQTCIAPDYLFVHEKVKKELFERLAFYIEAVFGKNIRESQYYPRIVNRQAMERLTAYLGDGKVVFGGQFDMDERYIAPTLLDEVKFDSPVMQEEIFGPILPAITFTDIDEVVRYVNQHEKPLAFYYFGDESSGWKVFGQTTSGGGCINDTLMHIVNHQLPFGGVGNSGLGKYHGRESFLAFSNRRAVVSTPTWIDLPFKYVPFKYFGFVKKLLG